LASTVYALDATTIDLCSAVFPWAPLRKVEIVATVQEIDAKRRKVVVDGSKVAVLLKVADDFGLSTVRKGDNVHEAASAAPCGVGGLTGEHRARGGCEWPTQSPS
jgi:hypothetical protein